MKTLVTGGAGFIGRHLVRRLVSEGNDVIVVDSGVTGRLELVDESAQLIHRDIAEISVEEWRGILEGVETVFHLAAAKYNTPGVTAQQLIDSNITATWNLAVASATSSVEKFVFTSSLYANGSTGPEAMSEGDVPIPFTLYGTSKLAGEHILRSVDFKFGLDWAAARLLFVYGPGQFAEGGYKSVIVSNFERMRNSEAPTICGSGAQRLDYIYVDDVVEALVTMSKATGTKEMVNLGNGVGVSINELTELMLQVAGSDLEPVTVDADWTDGTARYGSNERAREIFSWSPQVSLRDGLTRVWSE